MDRPAVWHPRMLIDGAPTAYNSSTVILHCVSLQLGAEAYLAVTPDANHLMWPQNVSAPAPTYPSFGPPDDLSSSTLIKVHEGGWIIVTAVIVTYTAICEPPAAVNYDLEQDHEGQDRSSLISQWAGQAGCHREQDILAECVKDDQHACMHSQVCQRCSGSTDTGECCGHGKAWASPSLAGHHGGGYACLDL